MNWEFVVLRTGDEERRYPIRQGIGYVGRHGLADHRLDANFVGRLELEVRADGDQVTLTSLNNRSRVYVNNHDILLENCILRPGDTIRIGDFLLKFQQAETDETEATRSPSWNDLESNPGNPSAR